MAGDLQKEHKLKLLPQYFDDVADGRKPFEVRFNDRGYRVGDCLLLCEWDHSRGFTGRRLAARITYVFGASCYMAPGFVILGLADVRPLEYRGIE